MSEKPGDDKILQKPIEIMDRVEAALFLPEDCREVCEHGKLYCDPCDYCLDEMTKDYATAPTAIGKVWITKDSGQRQQFSTGMVRDVQTDKPRYDLLDRPMLKRWAELMARGAKKYGEENWRKAETEEEMKRFAASLLRHTFQLLDGDRSEDHAAAICFNASGYEMVRTKLGEKK